MSGTDTNKGFSLQEADIDSAVLFKSIWRHAYLIVGGAALIGLVAWFVCYQIYPDSQVGISPNSAASRRALFIKIIIACTIGGILLISTLIILMELMSGRALIAPFVEQKNMLEDKLVALKHGEDKLISEEKSDDDYTVDIFARALQYLDISRILAISAEGDNGAVVTLELVRELADRGSKVILVDMTGTGAVSATMLDGHYETGITDLLLGRVRFADAIHADHYSDAHVMPLGSSDPAEAMQNEKDLCLIIEALETVYDLVVLECGPSRADEIRALVSNETQVALTVYDDQCEVIFNHAKDLSLNGFASFIRLRGARWLRHPPNNTHRRYNP